jgi:hypothetical protein
MKNSWKKLYLVSWNLVFTTKIQVMVFWAVMPCRYVVGYQPSFQRAMLPPSLGWSSETLISYCIIGWCHNPEDHNMNCSFLCSTHTLACGVVWELPCVYLLHILVFYKVPRFSGFFIPFLSIFIWFIETIVSAATVKSSLHLFHHYTSSAA